MEDAPWRYRKRSYFNRILSNEQIDCEEELENSKKLKETNGRTQTKQLDAIRSGNSCNRVTDIFEKNIFDKLTTELKIKPGWYNFQRNNNSYRTFTESTICDYTNKSRCSNRFKDDAVLNTSDFTSSYTNKSHRQRDFSYSSNSFASSELENFFDKYSNEQYLSKELIEENETPRLVDPICSANFYNCFNASSPLDTFSTETFATPKSTLEEKRKYVETALSHYFKQNKPLRTVGGRLRRHENIAKRLTKPIKTGMSKSATGKGYCFIGHLPTNLRSDSGEMKTSLSSSEKFCKSLSFGSSAELKASTNLGFDAEIRHRSTDIVEQRDVNILREIDGNTSNRLSQETKNAKPFKDILAECNMNFQGNGKESYFWRTLRYDSKVLNDEQSYKLGFSHSEMKNSAHNVANKENLPFRKERFFKCRLNSCLNSTESMDVTNPLNMDAQDTVKLIHNANSVKNTNCFGTTNLISQVREESSVKENNDLVAGKRSTACNCQSEICRKNNIQPATQIMSRSQTNMEVFPPSTQSFSYLSNSNTIVTTSRNNLNNPSSMNNETLTASNTIHESNERKVNSAAVSTTPNPENVRISNLVSDNASKPLSKLDETEADCEKNVNVAERLICNEAAFQCTDETAKSLVRSSNSQYLYSYQNNSNDRFKENDTSKNNKVNTSCSEEFRYNLHDFSTEHAATETYPENEEANRIFCSQNDCFSQPQSILRNSKKNRVIFKNSKTSRTISCTPTSILYEDNLLKQLLDEKPDIIKSYNKRISRDKQPEVQDGIMAKTYIKKYRNNNTRIYKIKRRFRIPVEETYVPKEHKLINKFLSQTNGDSRNELLNENEDSKSVTTSSSYLTDESTLEDLSSDITNRTEYQIFLENSINIILKDKSLIFSKFSDTAPLEINSSDVLTKIEEIMIQLLSDYERGKNISLSIPSISNCVFRDSRYQLIDSTRRHNVLRNSPNSRWRFNLILFILNKIRILLQTNSKLTKREIFYQLKTNVRTQQQTDRAIGLISRMMNVGLWALNITAQKGLVYGNIKLVMDTGETINCNAAGTLVPSDVTNICEIQSQAFFILVVEKESIFNKLLEEDLPNKLTKPFILITGKGYPDLSTQLFLKKLWMVMEIPVFIFVDADPDGISIMLTYRFGSKANVHVSEYLAIPKAKWIGVFPTEILNKGINYEQLNKREERKAINLLHLQCVQENPKIKKQIQTCLDTGVKASIEALIKSESYLSNQYLPSKFLQNDLI